MRAVDNVLLKKKTTPSWRGDDSRAGGRPPALSTAEVRELTKLVFEEWGKAVFRRAQSWNLR